MTEKRNHVTLTYLFVERKVEAILIPKGIIIDCLCVLIGGLIGSKMKDKVPSRIKEPLTIIFGICAIGIGIISIVKLNSMPAVLLSFILGSVIGELADLDGKVKNVISKTLHHMNFHVEEGKREDYLKFYLLVTVTLCASGTNIFGALYEGMTGDMTILLSKATMDIFASIIFATTLGYAMNLIVIPQFVFLTALFYASRLIMPFISESMMNDFVSVGGLITLAIGLSIAKIKHVNAVNMIPGLIFAFPISWIFNSIF